MNKERLAQILVDQAKEPLPEHLVSRWQYGEIQPLLKNKQVIIISGIRRCGKSTLMQLLRRNAKEQDYYINFDDDRLIQFELADFDKLLEVLIELYGQQNTFYFDEIQNIAGWERFVRRLHNNGKKVFITGSNARLLSSELGTHLTGRHITVKLYPYSFTEFIKYVNPKILHERQKTSEDLGLIKKYFAEYMQLGGMPEYIETKQKKYLHSLYENILYKDVIVRNKISLEREIKELVYYLASNNTKQFTYNSLRKLLGLGSPRTVSEYCGFLENNYMCFVVSRFSYSVKEQIHYAKKVYFIDQALAESIGFRFSEERGLTLENIVYLQLIRKGLEVFFHKGKKECDFIVREGRHVVSAIQVCYDMQDINTQEREILGLLEALHAYNLNQGLIITMDEEKVEEYTVAEKKIEIRFIPCWKWILDSGV